MYVNMLVVGILGVLLDGVCRFVGWLFVVCLVLLWLFVWLIGFGLCCDWI